MKLKLLPELGIHLGFSREYRNFIYDIGVYIPSFPTNHQ